MALSYDASRCRTLGHSWDPIPVTKPPRYGVAIDLRCEHCFTIRRDTFNRYTGSMMSRRYDYEDDYRDTEHRTRSDWRLQWVETLSDALTHIGPVGDRELEDEPEPLRVVAKKASKRSAA